MPAEKNRDFVRRFVDEVWNRGDLSRIPEFYAASYTPHASTPPGMPTRGPQAVEALVSGYRKAFPDLRTTVEEVISEGDMVVYRWSAAGSNDGEFMGLAPTHKRVQISGISILHLAGGKITEEWGYWNGLELMQQLGLIPPMESQQRKAA